MKPNRVQAPLKCVLAALILVSGAQAATQYQVLYRFFNQPGAGPQGALVADSSGNLYGAAAFSANSCGHFSCGVVFKLSPETGGKWSYGIIHYFNGPDGAKPMGSLIFDSLGNLYGTTSEGGAYGAGTVFQLSPSGSGWAETVLYSFGGGVADLTTPLAGVIFDANGNLYGTAQQGGKWGFGGVFELQPSSSGWQEQVIHDCVLGVDGGFPDANLTWDSAGNLYSTAPLGGINEWGVVFELVHSSQGWTEKTLYTLPGQGGWNPRGGVIFDPAGNLYGTTQRGGAVSACGQNGPGCGTVFQLTTNGVTWYLNVLHSFISSDGQSPYAGLVFDSAGNLYGTTSAGGADNYGVVFKLSPSGGGWTETVVHTFKGSDGENPHAGLILDQHGVLYGTAFGGGFGLPSGDGVVFSIMP